MDPITSIRPFLAVLVSALADIPIVLQSSIPENAERAHECGARFLLKGSPMLLHQLRAILMEKQVLLNRLDPAAIEAVFSPTLAHWLGHPLQSLAYVRLAHREAVLIGARGTVDKGLAVWRRIHLAGAALLTAGILIHVVTVTLFAGYVADGGPIHWWHLAAWGG